MNETIKKYIIDEEQLSLAKELIDNFDQSAKSNKKINLKLNKLSIYNFGPLKNFDFTFDKNKNIFCGDRGSGKSLALESWIYLLTGESRSVKDVIGEYDKSITGELNFNDNLFLKWKRSEKAGEVRLYKTNKNSENEIITEKINDLANYVEKIIGMDPKLITSTIHFSPKLSFLFSKKMPFEVEELIIKISKLDIWLKLEEFAKEAKKEEEQKLEQIKGAIGYISEFKYTEEETKKIIAKFESEINDIDKQIKKIEMPNVNVLNKRYQELIKHQEKRNEILFQIAKFEEIKKNIKSELINISEMKTDIEKKDFDENTLKAITDQLKDITEKQCAIKTDGITIARIIEEKNNIISSSICPILKKECDDLKKEEIKIKEEIVTLALEKDKLSEEYKKNQKEIKKFEDMIDYQNDVKKEIISLTEKINKAEITIKELEISLKKINIEKVKSESKQYLDKQEELNQVLKETNEINKDIKLKQKEKDELFDKKTDLLSDVKDYTNKLDEYKNMKKFIKEKKSLEERQNNYEILIKKFGKKEIPKMESQKVLKKINGYLSSTIKSLSDNKIDLSLKQDFSMNVKLKDKTKMLSPKVVSDGEEFVINLAFVMALGFTLFNGNLPYLFVDDIFAYQSQETSLEILESLTKMQETKLIDQLYLCSNRFEDLNIMLKNKFADKILTFKNGEIQIWKVTSQKSAK